MHGFKAKRHYELTEAEARAEYFKAPENEVKTLVCAAIQDIESGRTVRSTLESLLVTVGVPATTQNYDKKWFVILLTDAVNWSAKIVDGGETLYRLKAIACAEAAKVGMVSGWRDDIFYIYHPETGEVSFHDPFGELKALIGDENKAGKYPFLWSGVTRQNVSWECLADDGFRKEIARKSFPKVKPELGWPQVPVA